VKKPQWIAVGIAVFLTACIFIFGRAVPRKKTITATEHAPADGHNHENEASTVTIDSILLLAKKQLTNEQLVRINTLENSITRGDVQQQQLHVYHQLARFWADSVHIFEPYAWYTAEAARLENSEKTLTFAAHLFLENLQEDELLERRQWKALQAKDLFERSLKIDPSNDSAKVGLGACYLFGNITSNPMEGILKIREVTEKDSTNTYAQIMLAKGSVISGQYDKAISRLESVNRMRPDDIDAILLLAEVYERAKDKENAARWYEKSLSFAKQPELRKAIAERIAELKK
jgi:tetratricopeptide (TPR) repeat protein